MFDILGHFVVNCPVLCFTRTADMIDNMVLLGGKRPKRPKMVCRCVPFTYYEWTFVAPLLHGE